MPDFEHIFRPIRGRRSFEEVAVSIKELVFDGVLQVGDRLPSEIQLAKQFNVGRQTIREALRLLELSGFITIQRGGGGGATIKNTILSRISDLFLDAFRMGMVPIEELTQARLEIEKVVLHYAIQNADGEDLRLLQENVDRARKKIKKNIRATEENFEFHTLLARASKNRIFVIVVESIMAIHGNYISRVGFDLEVSRNVVTFHEAILKAIKRKQRKRAVDLFTEHMLDVRDRLQSLVEQENSERRFSGDRAGILP
ncbi:MAG: FadR family transcriptional regulator, partial [Deltaproteobacteria bacterium]|nr:FadR family transcriptional regulator [Deltaproteobacteria bacterium]MBW1925307.1 FadR family transcriptional regulator [Deltaproteobacteria bacterium]MBW1950724.1 FadR family transcriptional regulator [Deltaproteobacteria bacterium]MBW2008788.1 FadR family transcriptional regulator [Deltaproteobacteria bacterium]MBW2102482.1 FadR family transcriptional regulator [Deltaproteobacteria bacterium]